MKVLIINGSPRSKGNCSRLVDEILSVFNPLGIESEVVSIGNKDIRGCMACSYCATHDGCVFKDIVNETSLKLKQADGLILLSPVYYASPNGSLIAFLDRLFYSANFDLSMKVGAAFAVARRAGTTCSFDVLNKYFTISGMPLVSGDYWNNGFGAKQGEIEQDKEGLRNARMVAKRMAFLMKAIKEGKEKYPELLEEDPRVWTNFFH